MSDSRLDSLRIVDPILTNLAAGYTPSNFIGRFLFPTVKVKSQKGRVPIFGKDSFVLRDSNRAIRSNSNRIPTMEFQTIEFSLQERDLEVAMDYLEEMETYDLLQYEQKLVMDLLNLLELEKEKTIADYVQNPDNFSATNKIILDSSNNFLNGGSPRNIIQDAIESVRKQISRMPNLMIMGSDTLRAIINHTEFNIISYNIGKMSVDLQVLKEGFGIKNIIIGQSVYSEDGREFKDMWKDKIIIAYVDESPTKSQYNPSYGYVFQRDGMPEIDSYYENGGKVKIIRATDNWEMKIVAPEAAFLISNTN